MARSETAKLIAELSLKDKLTPGLRKAAGSVDKFEGGMSRASRGVGQMAGGLARAGATIATGIGIGLAGAAKAAIDWEDAFTGVVKTVDASDADLKRLSDNLRTMATEMPNTASELALIAENAGAMGVGFDKATGKTNTDTIAAFTRQVAILSSTTNIAAEDAATGLGQLTNVLGLTADEYDNFSASLVDLGNKGASTESQIFEIARRAGGAAKLFGVAKEETLGWASAAANLGLNEELAGTALQSAFLKLLPKFTSGSKDLQAVTGKTAKELKRAFKEDAGGAIEGLIAQLGKMPKDKRLAAVQKLFGKTSGLNRLILGLADSYENNLAPALDTSTEAWEEATAAQIEFDKRNATVKSAIARLKNGIVDAGITIGEGFVPALGRASSKLAEFLKQDTNKKALQDIGKDIGRAIDDIDWKEVVDGAKSLVNVMKTALDFAKRLYDAFNMLPTPVKGALAGVVAIDKLSGGLVVGGAANIAGGLGSALAKSLAASIPVFGKAFVQPVFVTNMGVGGMGGGGVPGKVGGMGAGALVGSLGVAGLIVAAAFPIGEVFAAALPKELKGEGGEGKSEAQTRLGPAIEKQRAEQRATAARALTQQRRGEQDNKGQLERVRTAANETKRETTRGATTIAASQRAAAATITSSLRTMPTPIVNVNVSATTVSKTYTTTRRYGPTGGSRNSDGHIPGRPGGGT